jgi:hypothetical protein
MLRRLAAVASLLLWTPLLWSADDYKLGPDSQEHPDVPHGKVTKHSWTSTIFPGTVRDYWVYVPAQYDAKQPACIMVFQDGAAYVNPKGQFRVPIVFDNRTAYINRPRPRPRPPPLASLPLALSRIPLGHARRRTTSCGAVQSGLGPV